MVVIWLFTWHATGCQIGLAPKTALVPLPRDIAPHAMVDTMVCIPSKQIHKFPL